MNTPPQEQAQGRVARRQRRNRDALIGAARSVMAEKGIDAATMLEIATLADVGAGTVYNYFKSKEDLAVAVLESVMHELALRIQQATAGFDDPAHVYAFGVHTVLQTAMTDASWKQLLYRSEVIADALFRRMGPYAMRDLQLGQDAGRFPATQPELVWRLTSHAIVGIALGLGSGALAPELVDEATVRLLCVTGIGEDDARRLAALPRPELPPMA